MDKLSDIAGELERTAKTAFEGQLFTQLLKLGPAVSTAFVKKTFGELGIKLGFKVAAHGYDAHDSEWLYDMTWYEQEGQFITRLPMVLESEWRRSITVAHDADVDVDFQKLVQSRAEVRVWVSTSRNPALVRRHVDNCKEQIRRFHGTESGDRYLFVINEWTTPDSHIELFTA